ncbi:MAG: neutral/alkaline non-lysosomal ceramidase N-terminal domain-containing protein [Pirellulaceae bacterium]|nr:neutral/alkaline non-lysosomal ceramidase N-terminal domain-containing protein [Pirellulaceae bacterium]
MKNKMILFAKRSPKFSLACITVLIAVSDRSGFAQDSKWLIGLAHVMITPDEPVRMSGYASRTQSSQGVASDLFAKALAIEDATGNRGLIITSDVIGFSASFAESTCQLISAKTGLQRNQILLNSSHTHTGPVLGLKAEDFDFEGEQLVATIAYSRGLQGKLVDVAAESLSQLKPAKLSWGVGVATFAMNRREFTPNGVILGFNPRGHVDRSVPILRIDSPEGELRGVLFGAACHNTTPASNPLQISGDFAGYAQQIIERTHPGAQAMFMQGCAGDANPHPRGTEELSQLHGLTLGDEVMRVLKTKLQSVTGPLQTSLFNIDLPLQPPPSREELTQLAGRSGSWRRFVMDKMLKTLDAGKELPMHYSTSFAIWQFGQDLTLVGLPGEVVVDYVSMLEERLGQQRLWIAAYCNDVFGYLPSARVLKEGGYETRGLYSGGVGFFSPQAQDVVVERIGEEADRLGRKP